jgi:hypothetical protein
VRLANLAPGRENAHGAACSQSALCSGRRSRVVGTSAPRPRAFSRPAGCTSVGRRAETSGLLGEHLDRLALMLTSVLTTWILNIAVTGEAFGIIVAPTGP